MKKYIENLTVAEYQTLRKFLDKLQPILNEEMITSGDTKDYVELRFIKIKIDKIIKKYQKDLDKIIK